MQSKAATVEEYLASLPEDRRTAIEAVRRVFLSNLDPRIEERMSYGMIGYAIPHSVYPPGYHCDPRMPLPYAGLASQKGHMSLYLMCVYLDGAVPGQGKPALGKWFREAWAKTGKKLDMGKSCIRFKKAEDLALDVIAEVIRRATVPDFIATYEAILKAPRGARAEKAPAKAKGKPASKAKAVVTRTAAKPPRKPAAAKKATSKQVPARKAPAKTKKK